MKIVAMLTRSAGNSEVGSMWTETKIYSKDAAIEEVIRWALDKTSCLGSTIKETLTLQIAQEDDER